MFVTKEKRRENKEKNESDFLLSVSIKNVVSRQRVKRGKKARSARKKKKKKTNKSSTYFCAKGSPGRQSRACQG